VARPTAQLRRLLDVLDDGDVLTVTRLDRLARSTRDLLNTLAAITGKKAGFKSLGDTWADTTTSPSWPRWCQPRNGARVGRFLDMLSCPVGEDRQTITAHHHW
jgi:hypothetical protein